jgi:hypothetical protein
MARHCPDPRRRERGFGAVYLLVLLSVAALLLAGLAERGVLGLARSRFAADGERARYLALAGAEHAVWRAHHEACFLEQNRNQDFTEVLGDGRYAYRVGGSLTDLVIEATGSVGDASHRVRRRLTRAPEPARAMVAYGIDDDELLEAREYHDDVWQTARPTDVEADKVLWTVLRGCPNRRERLLASLDANKEIYLQRWDGDSWTALARLANDGGGTRCFDVAYEQSSGQALVVYATGSDGDVHFRVWNGTTLSADQRLDLPFGSPVKWLAQSPRAGSDEIALLAIGNGKQLAVAIWNGNSFGAPNTLDSNLFTDDYEVAAVDWLEPSGAAVFAWNTRVLSASTLRVALWRDAWLLTAVPTLPADKARFLRLVGHTSGDQARIAVLTENADLFTITAGLTGLGLPLELVSSNVASTDRRCFDLEMTAAGTTLLAYARSGSGRPLMVTSSGAPGWSAINFGPDLDADLETIQLRLDPATGIVHVGIAAVLKSDDRAQLQLLAWSGSWSAALADPPELPPDAPEPFMMSVEGDVCGPAVVAIEPALE